MRYLHWLHEELHAQICGRIELQRTFTILFSLQATVGIDMSNGSVDFLLSLCAISSLSNHLQIRYLALFTDYAFMTDAAHLRFCMSTCKFITLSGLMFQKAGKFLNSCPQQIALYQKFR